MENVVARVSMRRTVCVSRRRSRVVDEEADGKGEGHEREVSRLTEGHMAAKVSSNESAAPWRDAGVSRRGEEDEDDDDVDALSSFLSWRGVNQRLLHVLGRR